MTLLVKFPRRQSALLLKQSLKADGITARVRPVGMYWGVFVPQTATVEVN
jgi:hypothetical protein